MVFCTIFVFKTMSVKQGDDRHCSPDNSPVGAANCGSDMGRKLHTNPSCTYFRWSDLIISTSCEQLFVSQAVGKAKGKASGQLYDWLKKWGKMI